jgi:branched-chain amino acid transport system substrate-binding protein
MSPATRRGFLASGLAGSAAVPALRAAAQGAPPIRVGLLLALTGPLARSAEDVANGFALALDEVDRKAAGRSIHVAIEDTQNKPSRTVERFLRLSQEEKIDLLVGPMTSAEALALRDYVTESGTPTIVPNAGVSALSGEKCSPFMVRVSYANEQIAGPLGTWLATAAAVKSAYLLAFDNIAGRDHVAAFRKAFVAQGGNVAGEELVPPRARDFSPYLGKLKLIRTEAIFASFVGDGADRLLEALDEFGLRRLKLCGPGWLATTLDLARAGARAAGIVGATTYLPELDIDSNRRFVAAFTQRHARPPTEFAAQGYDAGRLLVAAIEALEGQVSNRRATAAMLARTPFEGARGRLVIDPRSMNVIQDVYIFETRARPGGEGLDFAVLERVPEVTIDPEACKP